jgi:hypothetical protein
LTTLVPGYTNVTGTINNGTQSTSTVTSVTVIPPGGGGELGGTTSQLPVGGGTLTQPGLLMGIVGGLIAFLF